MPQRFFRYSSTPKNGAARKKRGTRQTERGMTKQACGLVVPRSAVVLGQAVFGFVLFPVLLEPHKIGEIGPLKERVGLPFIAHR